MSIRWPWQKPKPPVPPVPPQPWVCHQTMWVGGKVRALGVCGIVLDQYGPGKVFIGKPFADPHPDDPDATRWAFEFPPGTNPENGGNVLSTGVNGYEDYNGRIITPSKGKQDIADFELVPEQQWPATPTRDEVCSVRIPFQGRTGRSADYGQYPVFGPELSSLRDDDLCAYLDDLVEENKIRVAAGFPPWTHVEFAVSWNYQSHDYSYPIPGRDLSNNLPELKRRIEIAIMRGFKIALFCAGDGRGSGPGYNDPVGWTYGREWLLANFPRIHAAMGPTAESAHDCRPFMVFLSGYDGTDSYAWDNPENVIEWWKLARGILGEDGSLGYLGQEWSSGHCHLGGAYDGDPTYVDGPGRMLDVILQEFPAGPPMPTNDKGAVYQILGRMVHPYHRPADQTDDPNPPYYLRQGTPRGPYYYVAYEYDTYHWVRGLVSAGVVESDRKYLGDRGCTIVC